MVKFELECSDGSARRGRFLTAHGVVETPAFMPVATKGVVRTLDMQDCRKLGIQMMISNSFLLDLKPSSETIASLGGLQAYTGWNRPLATDSGGFQLIRSNFLQKIDAGGVHLKSPYDGQVRYLTPSRSMEIQARLGTDLAMILDDCPPHGKSGTDFEASMERTHDWAETALETWRGDGLLFTICQGGTEPKLRLEAAREMLDLGFTAFAVGGLSIGETQHEMYSALAATLEPLPASSPRYFMGLGSPPDLLEAIRQGVDLFDSAYPTRNARHLTVFRRDGPLGLKKIQPQESGPLDPHCNCRVCSGLSRGYIRHLQQAGEHDWKRLVTWHNLHFILDLMQRARRAIRTGTFEKLYTDYLGGGWNKIGNRKG